MEHSTKEINNYYILKFNFSSIETTSKKKDLEQDFIKKVIDGLVNFNNYYNTNYWYEGKLFWINKKFLGILIIGSIFISMIGIFLLISLGLVLLISLPISYTLLSIMFYKHKIDKKENIKHIKLKR